MIMVVMIGMTIAFAAVVEYSNSYKAGLGSSVLESLTIEDVWIFSPSNNTVNITLYNVATQTNLQADSGVDTTIEAIYVNGTALTNPLTNDISFTDYVITAGSHVTVMGFSSPGFFQSGNSYIFKVVTVRGSNFESQPIEYS